MEFRINDLVMYAGRSEFFKVVGQAYHERVSNPSDGISGKKERVYHLIAIGNDLPFVGKPEHMILLLSNETNFEKNYMKAVDQLLDTYNLYLSIYEQFQDEKYKRGAEGIMCLLRSNVR